MQRSFTSLIVGVGLGVVAVLLMMFYLRSARPIVQATSLGTVVVSGADFTPGTPVQPGLLKLAQWPLASIPDGSFASVNEVFKGATRPEDRVALKVIKTGEPVLRTNLSGFGGRATLSREVAR